MNAVAVDAFLKFVAAVRFLFKFEKIGMNLMSDDLGDELVGELWGAPSSSYSSLKNEVLSSLKEGSKLTCSP